MADTADTSGALTRTPTRRYEAKRNAIVCSAVQELNAKGVRGMTLGEVAARLDLVPTAVIYYFRNKEELAAAAFLKGIARFEALISESSGRASAAGRVAAFVRAFFDFKRQAQLGEAEPIAVFNDVRALNSSPVNEAYVEMFRHARRLLPGPETLPGLHRNARAHLLLSQIFWVPAWLHHVEVDDYGRAAERMVEILDGGMLPAGAAWPQPQPITLVAEDAAGSGASPELFLRAATQLINAEGYHGASVERISASLNVSKGAFYHHNETKDELVAACFQRSFDLMWRAIRAAESAGGSGLQVLVTAATALIEHQTSGGGPLLRTSALTTAPQTMQRDLIEKFDRLSFRFASILCDGIADGSVRPVDVNVAAQMITAAINAAAELHYWAPGLTPQTVADHYARPLFEGLSSPAA